MALFDVFFFVKNPFWRSRDRDHRSYAVGFLRELAEFVSAPDTDALAMKAWTTWERGTDGHIVSSYE